MIVSARAGAVKLADGSVDRKLCVCRDFVVAPQGPGNVAVGDSPPIGCLPKESAA